MTWKNGDAALVECSDGVKRLALYHFPAWRFADGLMRYASESVAHPVVVLSPFDPVAVNALSTALDEAYEALLPGEYRAQDEMDDDLARAIVREGLLRFMVTS